MNRRILLLPSNGKSAPFYEPLGEAVRARGFAFEALTLPGFDGTEPLDDPSWRNLIEHCRPKVQALGPGVLVGHSLGGMLAVQLAATEPISRLVLLEPAITPISITASFLARTYRKGAIDDGRTEFVNSAPGFTRLHDPGSYPPTAMEHALRCDRTTDRATLHALAEGFADQVIPWSRIRAPVTLVRGSSSGWVMHLAQVLLALRLGAERVTLADSGHWMANEQDGALAEILTRDVYSRTS